MLKLILAGLLGLALQANAATPGDLLVKLETNSAAEQVRLMATLPEGTQIEELGLNWYRIQVPQTALQSLNMMSLRAAPGVANVQPNYKVQLLPQPGLAEIKAKLAEMQTLEDCIIPGFCGDRKQTDNPAIPAAGTPGTGSDPHFASQWGMMDIGVRDGWQKSKGKKEVVVAVIDTGVDYTHEDLKDNLWRNPGEHGTDAEGKNKATNGKDDDGNGYVDDVIGWDFVSNDNKPYDLSVGMFELLTGGNPGHGTHCAGNVAARGFNGKGIAGVAPNVSIMSIRFLSEKGQGTIADGVKAVLYAVQNGAHILSNSWGSSGEDPNDPEGSQALKDAIAYAETKGSLFVAAAGNGDQMGKGYDNDTGAKPAYPASYDHDVIVSVAALDAQDALGTFSNWGAKTVDIGAPGVKVFSTTVGSKYSDTVLNLEFIGMVATWDGTSMATPHVAGAAALYLSNNPTATWKDIKDALIKSAKPIDSMKGKSVSGGKLNVGSLMNL